MYYYTMYVLGKLRRRFINQIPENNKQYLTSRRAFTIDGATALTIGALVSNTYLSGYLEHIGVSTSMNGIISAVPALVAVSQPLGAAFSQKYKKRKPLVSIGAFVHRLMFTLMFIIPLFINDATSRVVLAALLFTSAHFIGAFIAPAASNWIISLTPQRLRGKYFSIRELYSLILLSGVMLISGQILDYFKKTENQSTGFLLMGVILGILTLTNFISLSKAMEPESAEQTTKGVSLYKTVKMVLTEKSFRPILIMNILFNLGIQTAVPYHGIYIVSDLKISYFTISLIGFVCSVEKAFIIRRWGQLADRTSWANICKLTIGIIAVSHYLNAFLVQSNAVWLYPFNAIVANIGWAATGIAMINIQYDYAPLKGRTMYIGVCAAITGLIGFSGVFAGSLIISLMQKYEMTLFGELIKGQQVLMLISGVILTACITYITMVVEKKQKIINKKEGLSV